MLIIYLLSELRYMTANSLMKFRDAVRARIGVHNALSPVLPNVYLLFRTRHRHLRRGCA